MLSLKANATVFLLVKNEIADEVADKVEPSGVFVDSQTNQPRLFLSGRQRLLALRGADCSAFGKKKYPITDENRGNPHGRPGEVRADSIFKHDGKAGALPSIEKQAMDMRTTKMDIAQGILKLMNLRGLHFV